MSIKYEASGDTKRANLPGEHEEARQIARDTYRKARASEEELEQ